MSRYPTAFVTMQDPSEAELTALRAFIKDRCRYGVYGKEIAPTTGQPHVHAALFFGAAMTTSAMHKKITGKRMSDIACPIKCRDPTNIHFCPDYCKKGIQPHAEWELDGNKGLHFGDDADFWEHGTIPQQGKRTDLDEALKLIQQEPNWRSVINNPEITSVVAKNMTWARSVFDAKPPKPIENFEPREWQAELIARLEEEPDDRTIHWVYDTKGGAGKSTLCNYLIRNYGATLLAGKAQDMFFAYDMEKIVLVDLPRSTKDEYINYGAIEKLKDGVFFSGKYASALKVRDGNAHVVVFSNHTPQEGAWTSDRVNLIDLALPPHPRVLAAAQVPSANVPARPGFSVSIGTPPVIDPA